MMVPLYDINAFRRQRIHIIIQSQLFEESLRKGKIDILFQIVWIQSSIYLYDDLSPQPTRTRKLTNLRTQNNSFINVIYRRKVFTIYCNPLVEIAVLVVPEIIFRNILNKFRCKEVNSWE